MADPTPTPYQEKLRARQQACGSQLCLGLDPRQDCLPPPYPASLQGVESFLREVISTTSRYVAAYKPNIAYFEACGSAGLGVMERILGDIPSDIPVILDAKRGDIGETQQYYAKACFDHWQADAVTLNPFMGYDTLAPFLSYPGRGLYLLALTSNPGSADIQRLKCHDKPIYQLVGEFATRAREEGQPADVGLVLGLTNASADVLARLPDVPLLVPGLGAQGGRLDQLSPAGEPPRQAPALINVSRGILYPKEHATPQAAAKHYAGQLNLSGRPNA